MTKTYYDIEAVTKLLDEKEKDLELAATIGKQLLERDQQLEAKIEYLEIEVERTTEMVNQLRYDITIKDNLLKTFIDSETESYQACEVDTKASEEAKANADLVNEFRYKVQDLEDENETLRHEYRVLEQETTDARTKESVLIENCYRDLDDANQNLQITEEKLKEKTNQCTNQQEEIQNLFSQIYFLQQTIKSLTKDNNELQSSYDSSVGDLVGQINDLKEKYNECLKVLSRTQEELLEVRKRYPHHRKRASSHKNHQQNVAHLLNSTCTQAVDASNLVCDDDDSMSNCEDYSVNQLAHSNDLLMHNSVHNHHRHNIPSNSNSFATEVFCEMAKGLRLRNNSLSQQAYQKSDFIKKVKQKLTKQIPGSHTDSCMESESEVELMLNSMLPPNTSNSSGISSYDLNNRLNQSQSSNLIRQFNNCPTPDSMFSTGSASFYSNLITKSNSFLLPEKLQIVKPIEGSQTLQHWQQLARPNLGCLFESRPGIQLKSANSSDSGKSQLSDTKEHLKTAGYNDLSDNEDDGVNSLFGDDYEFDINDSEILFDQRSDLLFGDQYDYNLDASSSNHKKNRDMRVLSPNRAELLANLLRNEESMRKSPIMEAMDDASRQPNFLYDFFSKVFVGGASNSKRCESSDKPLSSSVSSRHEFDDPDTPPSSPINLPNESNPLYNVIKSAIVQPFSNYFQATPSNKTLLLAPTPPGTPQQELDEEYLNSDEYKRSQLGMLDNNQRQPSPQETQETSRNFYDQIVSKLSLFTSFNKSKPASAPTPPGTPQNELDEDYINSINNTNSQKQSLANQPTTFKTNFIDQLVSQLSSFSFKSAFSSTAPDNTSQPQPMETTIANTSTNSNLVKPQPVYAVKSLTQNINPVKTVDLAASKLIQEDSIKYFKFVKIEDTDAAEDEDDIEPELVQCNDMNSKRCETPPPSPSKFSPPLPEELDYNEVDFKKSAFVKVASLNPLINKSIDLNSLLGSLSSLKRNQRAAL